MSKCSSCATTPQAPPPVYEPRIHHLCCCECHCHKAETTPAAKSECNTYPEKDDRHHSQIAKPARKSLSPAQKFVANLFGIAVLAAVIYGIVQLVKSSDKEWQERQAFLRNLSSYASDLYGSTPTLVQNTIFVTSVVETTLPTDATLSEA